LKQKKSKSPLRLNFLRNKKLLVRQKSFEESLENLNSSETTTRSVTKSNAVKEQHSIKYDEDDAYDELEQITEDYPQFLQ
jgi:hypothetical protein